MTPERLREMVDAATPGPWTVDSDEFNPYILTSPVGDVAAISDLVDESALADVDLIALAPELAQLCAEQHEVLRAHVSNMSEDFAREQYPKSVVTRTFDLLARFAALGEPSASGEERA